MDKHHIHFYEDDLNDLRYNWSFLEYSNVRMVIQIHSENAVICNIELYQHPIEEVDTLAHCYFLVGNIILRFINYEFYRAIKDLVFIKIKLELAIKRNQNVLKTTENLLTLNYLFPTSLMIITLSSIVIVV